MMNVKMVIETTISSKVKAAFAREWVKLDFHASMRGGLQTHVLASTGVWIIDQHVQGRAWIAIEDR